MKTTRSKTKQASTIDCLHMKLGKRVIVFQASNTKVIDMKKQESKSETLHSLLETLVKSDSGGSALQDAITPSVKQQLKSTCYQYEREIFHLVRVANAKKRVETQEYERALYQLGFLLQHAPSCMDFPITDKRYLLEHFEILKSWYEFQDQVLPRKRAKK